MYRYMHSNARLWREVDAVCTIGDVVISEEHPTTKFSIRDHSSEGSEIVFQIERSKTRAVGILPLGDHINRNQINRVFQVSRWTREQYATEPETRLENSAVAAPAGNTVASSDKGLAFFRAADHFGGLRP